jgi:hypothetical protein
MSAIAAGFRNPSAMPIRVSSAGAARDEEDVSTRTATDRTHVTIRGPKREERHIYTTFARSADHTSSIATWLTASRPTSSSAVRRMSRLRSVAIDLPFG